MDGAATEAQTSEYLRLRDASWALQDTRFDFREVTEVARTRGELPSPYDSDSD